MRRSSAPASRGRPSWMQSIATFSASSALIGVGAGRDVSSRGGMATTLLKPVLEVVVGGGQVHSGERQPGHRALEELTADCREHRIRQDGVDGAPAALDLG